MSFKKGDLITGVDRSYERSIYRFVRDLDPPEIMDGVELGMELEFVSFGGFKVDQPGVVKHLGPHHFRLATDLEVEISQTGPVRFMERIEWLERTRT